MEWYIQFGYNLEGEIGNGTVQHLQTPWCISKLKIEVDPHVINYQNPEDTGEQITQYISMGFNLIKDEITGGTFEYSSMDENITIVSEDGIVTAKGTGTTHIKVYNKEHNIWGAVRINVNGSQGNVQPKIVGGNNHFVALKADGKVYAWGYNVYGQLGIGNTENQTEPVQMKTLVTYIDEETGEEKTREEDITDAIDIACGIQHTAVLKSDGTVWTTRIQQLWTIRTRYRCNRKSRILKASKRNRRSRILK